MNFRSIEYSYAFLEVEVLIGEWQISFRDPETRQLIGEWGVGGRITSAVSAGSRCLMNDRRLKEVNKHAPVWSRYNSRIERIESGAIGPDEKEERKVMSVVGSATLSVPPWENKKAVVDWLRERAAVCPVRRLTRQLSAWARAFLFFACSIACSINNQGSGANAAIFTNELGLDRRGSWSGSFSAGELLWMALLAVSSREESQVHWRSKVLHFNGRLFTAGCDPEFRDKRVCNFLKSFLFLVVDAYWIGYSNGSEIDYFLFVG